jgi:hypothetical protein
MAPPFTPPSDMPWLLEELLRRGDNKKLFMREV